MCLLLKYWLIWGNDKKKDDEQRWIRAITTIHTLTGCVASESCLYLFVDARDNFCYWRSIGEEEDDDDDEERRRW